MTINSTTPATLIINRTGLTWQQVRITAESTVELVEHTVGRYVWMALLIDGIYYDLVQWKHYTHSDAMQAVVAEVISDVQAAITALVTPPTPPSVNHEQRAVETRARAIQAANPGMSLVAVLQQAVNEYQQVPQKSITFDRITKDYELRLDGELVGYAATYHDGETTLNQLIFDRATHQHSAA